MSHKTVNELTTLADLIDRHEQELAALYEQRTALLEEGVALGIPSAELANAARVSRARVSQVAPVPKPVPGATATPAERETASEKPEDASCGTRTLEPLYRAELLSGRYSSHQAKPYGRRPTMWVDLGSRQWIAEMGFAQPLDGDTLAAVLRTALFNQATRVFLVGPPPVLDGEAGDAGIRAWFLDHPGNAWSVAASGHHLSDARTPTARYLGPGGHTVEIMRTAAWWGDEGESVSEARTSWFMLQEQVQKAFGDSARLLATPATTGRDLWQRTIGPKTTYPVLGDEVRELIHATAGQGRIELCEPPEGRTDHKLRPRPVEIPGVHVRDGRLMYAALTWGMPVGSPTLLSRSAIEMMTQAQLHKAIMGRSRWRVAVKVPNDWRKPFGLLMAPRPGGTGWHYPAGPGHIFETWCDGSELALAIGQGWEVRLQEAMTWREAKPLNTWAEKLLEIWHYFDRLSDPKIGRLCCRAIRSLLLFSIGAFASRNREATFTVPEAEAGRVPAGVPVHRAGDMLVWTQTVAATSWSAQLAHPEWSATIWARARVRLLDGPGVKGEGRTGALHLPDGIDVLGFRTDALILTGDPGWGDDGKAGRLRYDGSVSGPFDWPETESELLQLKTKAQNAGRTR